MRVLSLLFSAALLAFSVGCLSPVDAYLGGYVGPLSKVGSVEKTFQAADDAPLSPPATVDVDAEIESRFSVAPSGAADVIVSGLLDDVVAATNLAIAPDCHIPLTLRDGRLVLDEAWPCDTSEITEIFDGQGSTVSTDVEVTVTELMIEPGRGEAAVEVAGTVEVDVVSERRDVDRVQREFGSATLSFTHLGRRVAQE